MEPQGFMSMPGVGFFGFIIIGLIAGYIAEKVLGRSHGLLTNLIVGVIGSFVGGFLANAFNFDAVGWWDNLITATIGAIVFLFIWGLIRGGSSGQRQQRY
jgi:uncharacterized membrane protein YeaQ/YmgE (transglycosylase-associated protein family)